MSIISDMLRADRDAVVRAFAEKARGTRWTIMTQAGGGIGPLLGALLAADEVAENTSEASAWAAALADQSQVEAISFSDVLSGLSSLERIIQTQIVRHAGNRKELLAALSWLHDAMDLLRRQCAKAMTGQGSSSTAAADSDRQAFLALAEQSQDILCLATLQGKPFYFNKAGRRWINMRDGDEIPLTSLRGYHDESSWAELRDVGVPAVKHGGLWHARAQLRGRRADEEIEVDSTMFLVRDPTTDKPTCLAVIHRPCGHEAALEEALTEADARKHAILESSLDPIITIDHRGVISEFNRAAEQVFGRVREEVLGTKPSDILFPPSKIAGHQNRINRYLDAGEGSLLAKRTEVMAIRADGHLFEAELTMTISQERGMPVLTFFVRDISQRRRAEEQQQRYACELERSNRELEQFAYVASHDLQEPLRKIRTFGDRLQASCGDSLDELGKQCIERMQNAAGRMQDLINGLLNLSRVTTKGVDFVKIDLGQVAREVVADLEVKIEQSGAQVECGELPTIQADPLQMRQLFQNLVGNALKFHRVDASPRVTISAKLLPERTERGAAGRTANDERCRIEVKDNGIGFDEKYLDRIFDVFQRLHPREVHEGTGVGLAICRKIVDRHGGTITARSAPGQGAAFIVELPLRHPQKADNSRQKDPWD